MRQHNGKQLYGLQKLITTLKMGLNKELKGLSIKLFQDEGFYVAVSFVPDKPLVSDRKDIFKVIEFFKENSRVAAEKAGHP